MIRLPIVWRIAAVHKALFVFVFLFGVGTVANVGEGEPLLDRVFQGDSVAYIALASQGYKDGSASSAYYPLWPAMIRLFSLCSFTELRVAALVLANGLSLVALWLFYDLVKRSAGGDVARDALILMSASPGAMFLSLPYTEPLFLTLILLCFRCMEEEKYLLVALVAFFIPLTKAIGIFVIFPLASYVKTSKVREIWKVLVPPFLGYIAYFGIMYIGTGNAFEGFWAQSLYPHSPSVSNMLEIKKFVHAFVWIGSVNGMLDAGVDRVMFVGFVAVLALVFRFKRPWFVYSLFVGLVPALTSRFISYRRYCVMCFPMFVAWAMLIRSTNSRLLFWYVVIIMGSLQVWGIIRWVDGKWAG